MPPLEAWEKVMVTDNALTDLTGTGDFFTVHAKLSCVDCHGGSNVDDFESAHEGVMRDPSEGADSSCADCHFEHAQVQSESLHYTLAGYNTVLEARWDPTKTDVIDEMMENHCDSCHTSCGQCHVSQPTSVGGGLWPSGIPVIGASHPPREAGISLPPWPTAAGWAVISGSNSTGWICGATCASAPR